jgi:rhomboid family protein
VFIPLKDENPTARFPLVTVLLIVLNSLIFLIQVFSPQGLSHAVLKMGAIPYEITHFHALQNLPVTRIPPVLALVSSMFIHGGLLHLVGNMLYLWIFGNNIEDFLGSARFLLFYLVCGLSASLTHIMFNPNSTVPMVGASGAIAGVLGAYFVLYPAARVMTLVFFWVVPVPAAIVLGLWFLMQVLNVGLGGGVAWFAHIGGFLMGIWLVLVFRRRRRSSVFG